MGCLWVYEAHLLGSCNQEFLCGLGKEYSWPAGLCRYIYLQSCLLVFAKLVTLLGLVLLEWGWNRIKNSFKRFYSKNLPFIRKNINASTGKLGVQSPHRTDPQTAEFCLQVNAACLSRERSTEKPPTSLPNLSGTACLFLWGRSILPVTQPSKPYHVFSLQWGKTPIQMHGRVTEGQNSNVDNREYQGLPPATFPQELIFLISKNI